MMETLLTVADQKEGLSLVYAKALATRAGFLTSVPEPDRDSVGLRIQAGGPRRPALELQLKATVDLPQPQAGVRPFRLSIKNYNDLRILTQTPRLLVVLELPKDESRWMTVTAEEVVLRRRAYLMSLQGGYDEVVGQQTVTVHIPEHNVFDVEALRTLMQRATEIDGQRQSVMAVLERLDYERAVQAHGDRALVVLSGDLERMGQRWRLLNPRLEDVLRDDGQESQDA